MRTEFKWNEHIIKKQIQSDVEIPDQVIEKKKQAYKMIKSGQVKQIESKKNKRRFLYGTLRLACALVLVLAASFMICTVNPVFAKNLPIIGGLFKELQDKVSFFGNFTDKATVLEDTTSGDVENSVYTQTADGLTITFSEVYANDQSIYLSMQVKGEEPFPDMMKREVNGRVDPVFSFDFMKNYSFIDYGNDENSGSNTRRIYGFATPEGTLADDSTYNCILRLDLNEDSKEYAEYDRQHKILEQQVREEIGVTQEEINDETEQGRIYLREFCEKVSERSGGLETYITKAEVPDKFTLSLNINQMVGTKAEPEQWDSGYTPEELENMTPEEAHAIMNQTPEEYMQYPNSHQHFWYEGAWDFEIPITIDRSKTITMEINETNEEGIGLRSVVKTPYELTFNLMYEPDGNSDIFMVALDADGNKLPYIESDGSVNQFAIQNRDISTVDVYFLDYLQYMNELKGEAKYNNNESKPEAEKWSTLLEANAKYHKKIHF